MHLATRLTSVLALAGFASVTEAHAQAHDAAEAPARARSSAERGVELSVSTEAIGVGFRAPLGDYDAFRIGGLFDEDEDWAVDARWLHRVVTLSDDVPVTLSIGLAGDVISFDRPDAEVFALAVAGAAEIPFPTELPSRFALDLAFAPDLTTFDDGDEVSDVGLRLECDVTPRATLFLGYREVEAEFEGRGEKELDGHLGLGVRFAI
jgi:hypothetical protein